MPIDYSKYPKNWKTWIRPQILNRAGNHCEECGLRNHARGFRDEHGFHEVDKVGEHRLKKLPNAPKIIKIVLTISHTDHDITNNDMMDHNGPVLHRSQSNLRALCQKCHLGHDKDHHTATRAKTKRRKEIADGQQELPLFTEEETV